MDFWVEVIKISNREAAGVEEGNWVLGDSLTLPAVRNLRFVDDELLKFALISIGELGKVDLLRLDGVHFGGKERRPWFLEAKLRERGAVKGLVSIK